MGVTLCSVVAGVRLSLAFLFCDCFFSNVCGQFNEILLLFCILLGDVLRLTILLVLIVMRRSFELRVDEIVVGC